MKVAVTGSSGLLGRHVAAALSGAGHDVLGIDAVAPPAGAGWAHVTLDVTELGPLVQVVRDVDALVHAAAIPRPTGRDPATVFRTNVAATYNAVEAAAIAGVRRLVYASSFSVLGYPFFERTVRPPYLPVDADHPVGAQDAYALSKWLGEEIVEAGVRRGALPSAVTLRMPWIQTPEGFFDEVGPRRRLPEAARDLWAYIDVRDAAAAVLLALERPLDGHRRLFISAADTFMDEETEPLVHRFYPGVVLKRSIPGFGSVIDTAPARDALCWAPRHSWRSYPREGTR